MLCSFLYDTDDLSRWRAIDALGRVTAAIAADNLESVRDLLRRLLWSMNDESGGAGWHSPEAIGAIVANNPVLVDDFGVLLGSFLNEEPLERGAHWGVAAVASYQPADFVEYAPTLADSLKSPDPYRRAYAVFALGAIKKPEIVESMGSLASDNEILDLYYRDVGNMRRTSVGEVVARVQENAERREPPLEVW